MSMYSVEILRCDITHASKSNSQDCSKTVLQNRHLQDPVYFLALAAFIARRQIEKDLFKAYASPHMLLYSPSVCNIEIN